MVKRNKTIHSPWRKIDRVRRWYYKHSKPSRNYNKKIRIANKKLCKKYPWLTPRNRWTGKICWFEYPYSHTELDDMPEGWRIAFGDIWCKEYQRVLEKENMVRQFRVEQIKEKWGELRFYHNGSTQALYDLDCSFESISRYICVRCGRLDCPIINNYGWYVPICKECYERRSYYRPDNISYEKRLEEAKIKSLDDMMVPTSMKLSTYSKGEESIRTIDISRITTKIREKNKKSSNILVWA